MATHFKGSEKEKAALNAYIALRRSANTIDAHISEHLNKYDLTPGQFGVLEALFYLGDMSQRELGEKLLSTKGNITLIIDNLEKRNLVKRVAHASDRRVSIIHLTSLGNKLIAKIMPIHIDKIVYRMSVLSEAEVKKLRVLCKKLGLFTSMQKLEK